MKLYLTLIVLVVGCATVAPWNGLELFHRTAPFPEVWRLKTHELANQYVKDSHDCDDMAQEMADYLHEWFEWSDMRLVFGGRLEQYMPGSHMWLEVWWDGYWWVFDPSCRKWMWKFPEAGRESKKRPINWGFDVYSEYPTDEPYWDGSGYKNKGDTWRGSGWIRSTPGKRVGG